MRIVPYFFKMLLLTPLGVLIWGIFRPWRQKQLVRQGLVAAPYREGALLLFFVFLFGLLGLTLTPIGFWNGIFAFAPFQGEINLIPFWESWALFRYYAAHGMWQAILINFLGNIVMFVPVGLFASLLMDKPRWWKSTLCALGLSLFIEIFQLFVSRGTDVDDVILNTLGGLLGHGLFVWLRRLNPEFVKHCARLRKGSA